jgi:hypothetical protein
VIVFIAMLAFTVRVLVHRPRHCALQYKTYTDLFRVRLFSKNVLMSRLSLSSSSLVKGK